MNRALRLVMLALCISTAASAQHSPPATDTPTTEPVRLESPPPPPPPPSMHSNGSSGWVDAKKPRTITLADIPGMFRPRN